jgi:hypothetical protein
VVQTHRPTTHISDRTSPMPALRVCPTCSRSFTSRHLQRGVYCSSACYHVARFGPFWSHIKKVQSGCWLWQRACDPGGYGIARHADAPGERGAHRIAYVLAYGAIPDGLCVCHRCDVPRCINPDHLWLGTRKDNKHDSMKKNRHVHHLNPTQVRQLRRLRASGARLSSLAIQFGVSISCVSAIALRRSRIYVR